LRLGVRCIILQMLALFMGKSMAFGLIRNSKSHNFSHGVGEQGWKIQDASKVSPALFVLSFLNAIKVVARYNVKVVIFMSASLQVNELFEAVAVASIECRSWQRATAAA
jgi:hypothetical protein